MNSSTQVITIGELLIDFFCTDVDVTITEGDHYLKQAGGAPANVAAAISKLGGQASFVGKVGDDPFGEFLEKTLLDQKVDCSMLLKDRQTPTTLAFVSRKKNGERDFVFHRGADEKVSYEEINMSRIVEAKLLHFGSATALLSNPFQNTYLRLMKEAKEKGSFISFDPNFRQDLWKGRTGEFNTLTQQAITYADFVKVSEEELALITGQQDYQEAVQTLHSWGASVVAVTLGEKGTLLSSQGQNEIIPSIQVTSIDSTGAGDAFVGALLYQWANADLPKELIKDRGRLKEMVGFANKVGAIVCTRVGAITALPTYEEVISEQL
jgi:fructokinase